MVMYLWHFVLPYLKAASAFLLGQSFRERKINVRQSLVFMLKATPNRNGAFSQK